MRWLEGQTKVILDIIQGKKRVFVHDKLTKIPFLDFPDNPGKEKVDLCLGSI